MAEARSLVVTTTADVVDANDGLTSLREAVAFANDVTVGGTGDADGDGDPNDTVEFAANLAGRVVALTQGELAITSDMTVSGANGSGGNLNVAISGSSSSRIFNVRSDIVMNVDSIGLRDGLAAQGGAIINTGTLTITDSVLSNNEADGTTFQSGGGAIYNNGGSVTILASRLQGNEASGIAGRGGAILSDGGIVTVADGSAFWTNSAIRDGGAIALRAGADAQIEQTVFLGNSAGNATYSGNGGALHVAGAGSSATLSRTTMADNTASEHGGGVWRGSGTAISLGSSVLQGNAALNGGALYNAGSSFAVNNTTFDANTATGGSGGALYTSSYVLVTNSTFTANAAALSGGALAITAGLAALRNNTFGDASDGSQGNVAGTAGVSGVGDGGAVHVAPTADVEITDTDFFGNRAMNEGGALWLSGQSDLTSSDSVFADNAAFGSNGGGGIFAVNGSTLQILRAAFDRNSALIGSAINAGGGAQTATGFLSLTASDLGTAEVIGSSRNDVIEGDDEDNLLRGGSGPDRLTGFGGNDRLYGGAGNDILSGGPGDDRLFGEGGDDAIFAGTGSNYIDGGTGNDRADFSAYESGIDVNIGSGRVAQGGIQTNRIVGVESVVGTLYDDTLLGDAGANGLTGGSGDDYLRGYSGDDRLYGGDGNDMLFGDFNADALYGGTGNDLLIGGDGPDLLDGGGGTDTVDYSASQAGISVNLVTGTGVGGTAEGDTLVSIEHIIGTQENDVIRGENSSYLFEAGDGDDLLTSGSGSDRLYGGAGDDTISSGSGVDLLYGGEGDDRLSTVGPGSDELYGESGNDQLTSGSGQDDLYGGDGDDILRGGAGSDALYGENGNDFLDGGAQFDFLSGGEGDDTIIDGGSFDTCRGDEGDDTFLPTKDSMRDNFYGGDGIDTVSYAHATESILINFAARWAGSSGWATERGAPNYLHSIERGIGGSGNDQLIGFEDTIYLAGGDGDDNISVIGTGAVKTLHGDGGNDTVAGGNGNDLIFGDDGNDFLRGRAGDDRLAGGTGDDTLQGDYNADVFVFEDGFGNDTINDFDALNDLEKIDLAGVTEITDFADLQANHLSQSGANVLITDGADTITLLNVNLADLGAEDFVF